MSMFRRASNKGAMLIVSIQQSTLNGLTLVTKYGNNQPRLILIPDSGRWQPLDQQEEASGLSPFQMVLNVGKKRKWWCQICHTSYNYPQTLKRHIRQFHTDEPTFRCEVCGKGLMDRQHFTKHMNKHSSAQGVQCQHCSKRFANKDDFLQHNLQCWATRAASSN